MDTAAQTQTGGPHVVILQGKDRLERAKELPSDGERIQVLAVREWADDISDRAEQRPTGVTPQDVNTTAEASLGTVALIEQIVARMDDDQIVVITDIETEGEIEALRAQFGDDLLVVDCDGRSAAALERQINAFAGEA